MQQSLLNIYFLYDRNDQHAQNRCKETPDRKETDAVEVIAGDVGSHDCCAQEIHAPDRAEKEGDYRRNQI